MMNTKMISKDELLHMFEELITNANNWIKDAEDREDWNDVSFHQGKKEAFQKMRAIIHHK